MTQFPGCTISEHFRSLKDPRTGRMVRHYLIEILIIAICAVICGADDWVAVEGFGRAKEKWLQTFLHLPNGIPSHDTFCRVFAQLDPEALQTCFVSWVQSIAQLSQGEIVPIDGKCLRHSYDRDSDKAAIYMVSAWASGNRLVLGQVKTDEKSNEITAIPELLSWLVLQGCIVTIDAIGCQTNIAQQIIEQKADYVLALKGNQGTLHRDVRSLFEYAFEKEFHNIEHDTYQTVNKGHGGLNSTRPPCAARHRVRVDSIWQRANELTFDADNQTLLGVTLPSGDVMTVESGRKPGRYILRYPADTTLPDPPTGIYLSQQQVNVALRRQRYRQNKLNGKNPRADIEATIGAIKRPFGNDKVPMRGKFRVGMMIIGSAMMVSLRRIHRHQEKMRRQAGINGADSALSIFFRRIRGVFRLPAYSIYHFSTLPLT